MNTKGNNEENRANPLMIQNKKFQQNAKKFDFSGFKKANTKQDIFKNPLVEE